MEQVLMVDAVFIGPNDLALNFLGYAPPKWNEPEYLALIDTVVEAARKANKPCGILAPDGEMAKWAKEKWGMQIMMLGTDVKAVQLWMGAQLAAAKK
jgi:4-hydroxy-2-oxoheptanedioate aldolase